MVRLRLLVEATRTRRVDVIDKRSDLQSRPLKSPGSAADPHFANPGLRIGQILQIDHTLFPVTALRYGPGIA
jgi:hypothetical protein